MKQADCGTDVVDPEHQAVHGHIAELLAAKVNIKQGKQKIPFSFFKKVKECPCIKTGTCACAKTAEHVLTLSSHIAEEIGLGLKTITIRDKSPWAVYSSLALLIINTTSGASM